jgi:membrane-bound lytic murein transglycosylase D
MGATTTQRLDQMTKDLETLHKQPAPPKVETAPKPPPVQAKPEPAVVKRPPTPKSESTPPKQPPVVTKTEPAPKPPAAAKTETAAPAKPAEPPEKKATAEKIHEVKPLETLYSISRIYGLSIDELKRLNDIAPTDNTVRTGQKLKVSK